MDNDDRRGQPTCHIAFNEATAILAGDALQCLAFELLSVLVAQAETQLQLIRLLGEAAGSRGMVAGWVIDLASVDKQLNLEQLQVGAQPQTGAPIRASVLWARWPLSRSARRN